MWKANGYGGDTVQLDDFWKLHMSRMRPTNPVSLLVCYCVFSDGMLRGYRAVIEVAYRYTITAGFLVDRLGGPMGPAEFESSGVLSTGSGSDDPCSPDLEIQSSTMSGTSCIV